MVLYTTMLLNRLPLFASNSIERLCSVYWERDTKWSKLTYSIEEAASKLTATTEDVEYMIEQGLLRLVDTGISQSIPAVDLANYIDRSK